MTTHRTLVKRQPELKIFSIRLNEEFAFSVADSIGYKLGKLEIKNFADKDIWVKYHTNIRGDDIFIIGSTNGDPKYFMELCHLIRAAKLASAYRVTAVIPCFGGRQDRKDQPRTSITARLYADFLEKAGADRIITMDLHAPQIQGFFSIPVDHLFSSMDFCPFFSDLNIDNLAVATTDLGGLKMAKKYKQYLGAKSLIIHDKDRRHHNEADVSNVIGDAKGYNVLLVDDLYDTGKSFLNAVDSLLLAGAINIYGWCTHPVLSNDALHNLESYVQQGKIKQMMLGDTLPFIKSELITKISQAKTFGEAIAASFENRSVSHLFIENKDEEDDS